MYKKSWPILYSKLRNKMGQDFFDRQCVQEVFAHFIVVPYCKKDEDFLDI